MAVICLLGCAMELAWLNLFSLLFTAAMMAVCITDGNDRRDLTDSGSSRRLETATVTLPLRLYQPNFNHEPTIGDLFKTVMIPQLQRLKRAPATISDYRTSVTKWEAFWKAGVFTPPDSLSGGQPERIPEPPAKDVTRRHLQAFADWYVGTGTAAVTVNRRVGLLVAILDAAADSDDHQIDVPKAPKRLPSVTAGAKVVLPIKHVEAIYNACAVVTWPEYDHAGKPLAAAAADYWRCLIVMLFNYGPRLQDLAAYECGRSPIEWQGNESGISFDSESPASEVVSDHGWLWFVPSKTQAVKSDPLVLPLPLVVRQHLETIRGDGTGLVFPFPRHSKRFGEQRKAIFLAAGVKPKAALSRGRDHYLPKDFRKTCLTCHQRANRGIGPFITGHAERGSGRVLIADRHYDNAEQALADHFGQFEQPAAFNLARPTE